jgi:adenylylsulfate kinase
MSTNIVRQESTIIEAERSRMNGHRSGVLWFTGLPGSGKSTIAIALEQHLFSSGIHSFVLDGDNVRHGLNRDLGFSPEARMENVRRLGEVSKLMAEAGLIVLTACVSPYRMERDKVRALFPEGAFIEIHVNCSVEECERRDPKGHYKKARAGVIPKFTGVSAPYEPPLQAEITIDSEKEALEEAVDRIFMFLRARGWIIQ